MDIRPSLEPFALSSSGAARTWGGRAAVRSAAQTCDRRGFQPCLPVPGRPQLLHCPEPPFPNPASLQNRVPPSGEEGNRGPRPTPLLAPPPTASPAPRVRKSRETEAPPRMRARNGVGRRTEARKATSRPVPAWGRGCACAVRRPRRRASPAFLFRSLLHCFFLSVAGGGVQSGRSTSRTRAKGHRGTEKVGAETPGVGNHVTSELKPGVERTEVEGIERPGRKRGVAGAPFWSHP